MFVAPLAIDLFVILACLGAIIIILTGKALVSALFQVGKSAVGWIPWVGGKLKGSLDKIEQRLVSSMSDVADGLQGVVGTFWHALGNLLSSIGHEIYGLAVGIERIGAYMHGVVRPWVIRTVVGGLQHGLSWLRHEATSLTHTVYRITKVIEHPVHTRIGGAVREITGPLRAALAHVEHTVYPRLRELESDVRIALPLDIARLRARTKGLAEEWVRLWRRVHRLEGIISGTLAVGIVATALGRLGGGWIFCRNWKKVGRSVCRLPFGTLEGLLGLLTDVLVLADICQVVPLLEEGFSIVATPMIDALSAAGKALNCGGGLTNEVLAVPVLYTPQSTAIGTLQLP